MSEEVDIDRVNDALRQLHINNCREAFEKAVAAGDFTQAQADFAVRHFADSEILQMLVRQDWQVIEQMSAESPPPARRRGVVAYLRDWLGEAAR